VPPVAHPSSIEDIRSDLQKFLNAHVLPAESVYEDHLSRLRTVGERFGPDAVPPILADLKSESRRLGLWNAFLSPSLHLSAQRVLGKDAAAYLPARPLSVSQYAKLSEIMGRSPGIAPEACNCSAPDTGNMEVLLHHGTDAQRRAYLPRLLRGESRSAFLMTERNAASSDAGNVCTRLTKIVDGEDRVSYVLDGTKWWSTGAMDPRCEVVLVVCRTDYSHPSWRAYASRRGLPADPSPGDRRRRHTVVVLPRSAPGISALRPLTVFGYDDAPSGHAVIRLDGVRVLPEDLVLGEGRGMEVARGRLGPGRVHHCMRAVGMAQRAYEMMVRRSSERVVFGKEIGRHGLARKRIAEARAAVESARALTLRCANMIDEAGVPQSLDWIALIKVEVPSLCLKVVDHAVQMHGGAGVEGSGYLAKTLAGLRTLRIADGPDDVHIEVLARLEVQKSKKEKENEEEGLLRSRL